jgi:hypothetical protein
MWGSNLLLPHFGLNFWFDPLFFLIDAARGLR